MLHLSEGQAPAEPRDSATQVLSARQEPRPPKGAVPGTSEHQLGEADPGLFGSAGASPSQVGAPVLTTEN